MTFQPLTKDQYQKAISSGFTPDQIIANEKTRKQNETQSTPPAPSKLQSASDAVSSWFPGKQLGTGIGNSIYGLYSAGKNLIKGKPKAAWNSLMEAGADNQKIAPKIIGDTIQSVALPASLAVSPELSIPKSMAAFGGLGFASGLGKGLAEGSNDPVGQGIKTGVLSAGVAGIVGGLSKLLGSTGDKIMNSAIKPSKADIEDGFSIDTIKKYDLGGSLQTTMNKTQTQMSDLYSQLTEKLQGSDSTIDLNDIYDKTASRLMSGSNKLKTFGSNTSMEGALEQLKNEVVSLSNPDAVSIPDAQLVKQASGNFGAWQFGVSDPAATAREKVYNIFYNEMKTAIEDASPEGVKGLNKQLSELIPIQNAILRRIPVAERNLAFGLTDMLTLSASVLNPHALILEGLNLMQKSAAAGNFLSKYGPSLNKVVAPAATLIPKMFTAPNDSSPQGGQI